MSQAGSYEARRLPQSVRPSSLELWGVWRGDDWLRLPGPGREVAWFVSEDSARREADQWNTRSWLLVPEQAPHGVAEGVRETDQLVDPYVPTSVLHPADGLVVDAGELFERKLR